MLTRVVASATAVRKAPSCTVKVQRRHYGLGGMSSYFSSYIPPTGVVEKPELPDQTPFDNDHRPRRIRGQLMSRLSKMINENDFYSITRVGKKEIRPPRPVDIPEPRSTLRNFFSVAFCSAECALDSFLSAFLIPGSFRSRAIGSHGKKRVENAHFRSILFVFRAVPLVSFLCLRGPQTAFALNQY